MVDVRSFRFVVVDSFAIVTTAPNSTASAYHDRMPLVVPPDLYDGWLDRSGDGKAVLAEAQTRAEQLALEVYPTNPIGNSSRFEGPEAVERYILEADD